MKDNTSFCIVKLVQVDSGSGPGYTLSSHTSLNQNFTSKYLFRKHLTSLNFFGLVLNIWPTVAMTNHNLDANIVKTTEFEHLLHIAGK